MATRRRFLQGCAAGMVAALDNTGLSHNTIIVFFGDHGYHLGEHGWWNKNTLFEPSARAPLIVVTPGMKRKGSNCQRIVELVDIYPTLAELCCLPAPGNLEGISFRPLLGEPDARWKKAAFTQVVRGRFVGRSVRSERWRYTEWDNGKQGLELYDHHKDPGEYYNLSGDSKYRDVMAEMRAVLRSKGLAHQTRSASIPKRSKSGRGG